VKPILLHRLGLHLSFTFLMLISGSGCSPTSNDLVRAASRGDTNRVKGLLLSGVPINSLETGGLKQTPLAAAAGYGNQEMVGFLLKSGADPNLASGHFGTTPLIEATLLGDTNIVRMLLDSGADPNRADMRGNRPLDYARASEKETVTLLESKGGVHGNGWKTRDEKIRQATNFISIPFKVETKTQ
jgi:ankyrin repeat protein